MSDEDDKLGQEEYGGTHEGDYITPDSAEKIADAMDVMAQAPEREGSELSDRATSDALSSTASDIRAGVEEAREGS